MPAWNAKWISYAYDPRQDLGVFAFRRRFHASRGGERRIRVSADNRYKLYCNGNLVGMGPQRGDERHWFYETYDLAPFIQEGDNWLLALVWNFGRWAPMAQHSARTGFVLEGDDLSTPHGWEVRRVESWSFDMMHSGVGEYYIDVGPGEIIRAGTEKSSLVCIQPREPGKGLEWQEPHVICNAEERGTSGGGTPWMLIPRSIPAMKFEQRWEAPRIRRGFAGDVAGEEPQDGTSLWDDDGNVLEKPFKLVPGVPLVLDYGELLTAYPRLFLSAQGKAQVTLTYDEALWNEDGSKGHRDEVAGKSSRGYQDKFLLDGWSEDFEPLWWRTYRYLKIETDGEVDLLQIDAMQTGYPYEIESSFEADDPWVRPIWDVAVRTAQRCAGETYFDCPYYEQMQYVGDSRIQALIGYYLGRDRRLQRNCIDQIGWSIMENGLTQSRYPSRQTQVIPPFSLWWVMMVCDQILYDVVEPDKRVLTCAEDVIDAWSRIWIEKADKFWCFGDWVQGWRWGVPPRGSDSTEHYLTYVLARFALERAGMTSFNDEFWFKDRPKFLEAFQSVGGLLAMDGRPAHFSEHIEALYRLSETYLKRDHQPWPTEALERANAAKCTYYFSYYKHLAMFGAPEPDKSNRSNRSYTTYMDQLAPWKEQIEAGLTTFAENPEPTRSDCHAWSAHPILGFFQIVAGVTSLAPAWKKARIMPHPGNLKRFDARIAHPDGELRVAFDDGLLTVDSPVPFELRWRGRSDSLAPGRHTIS